MRFIYRKNNERKVVDDHEVSALLADGWFATPFEAENASDVGHPASPSEINIVKLAASKKRK